MEHKEDKLSLFGDWVNNVDNLQDKFVSADPFEHIIIPNFLNEDYANKLLENFPVDTDKEYWHKYNNPLEVKYTLDNLNKLPNILKEVFYLLSTSEVTEKFSVLSNINNLEYDPYLHGAGLHVHPRNGRLHMHLDYEKHPNLNKQRRLNIILYLNKEWDPKWNGDTQLWDENMERCVVKSEVQFNTAIIFKTNEISWHGLPEKIGCPEGVFRKTLAYYYISDLDSKPYEEKVGNDGSGYRTKAAFKKRPTDEYCEKIDTLYKIRPYRLIQTKDLEDLNIEWN